MEPIFTWYLGAGKIPKVESVQKGQDDQTHSLGSDTGWIAVLSLGWGKDSRETKKRSCEMQLKIIPQ